MIMMVTMIDNDYDGKVAEALLPAFKLKSQSQRRPHVVTTSTVGQTQPLQGEVATPWNVLYYKETKTILKKPHSRYSWSDTTIAHSTSVTITKRLINMMIIDRSQ